MTTACGCVLRVRPPGRRRDNASDQPDRRPTRIAMTSAAFTMTHLPRAGRRFGIGDHDRAIRLDQILLRDALHVGRRHLVDAIEVGVDQIRDRSQNSAYWPRQIGPLQRAAQAGDELRFWLLRAFSISQSAIGPVFTFSISA